MRNPHYIDIAIGRKIRALRTSLALSQRELGRAAGVSPQQIHKYETGVNRAYPSTLWKLAKALGVELHELCNVRVLPDDPGGEPPGVQRDARRGALERHAGRSIAGYSVADR